MKSILYVVLTVALSGCSAGPAEQANAESNQDLRSIAPNEIVGPAPSSPQDFLYDGTTKYQALTFTLTERSNVHASLTARTAGRQVVAWITHPDGETIASSPVANPATLDAQIDVGDYLLVFRDANQLPSSIGVDLVITPVVTPPQLPPPSGPSFLLPPGKNGASATAEFQCSSKVEYLTDPTGPTPAQYQQSTISTKSTCAGQMVEQNNSGARALRFMKSGPCVQTKVFDRTIMADVSGNEEILSVWTYSPSKDAYVFERGPSLSETLFINPTFATGSIHVPHAQLPLMNVLGPKVPMRPEGIRLETCTVRFSY